MKIEIEFTSTYEATVTIDGRTLEFGYRNGAWSYHSGITRDEAERTIGGLVASKLMSPMIDVLQAWMPEELVDPPPAWKRLPREIAWAVEERMDR